MIEKNNFIKRSVIFLIIILPLLVLLAIYEINKINTRILPSDISNQAQESGAPSNISNPTQESNTPSQIVKFRRKILFPNASTNHQIVIYLDTETLIQQGKLSFDCSDLYFTDLQDKIIPYWMEKGECYNEKSVIWLNVPEDVSVNSNPIYVYYSNANITSFSNFNAVFPKDLTPNLVAGFFLGPNIMNRDFSGYNNNGSGTSYSDGVNPTFNHWGCGNSEWYPCDQNDFNSVNFTAPTPKNIDFSSGTIELWVNPYVVKSDNYQKIFFDSNRNIELGLQPSGDLYFYPAQAQSKNYNLIKNALNARKWNHIVVTWDYNNKNSTFYINGKKINNYIENVPKYWTEKTKVGDKWNVGGFAYAGEIAGLQIYSKAFSEFEVTTAYKMNNQKSFNENLNPNTIGPQIKLGIEKLLAQEGSILEPLESTSTLAAIQITDSTKFIPMYASPQERGENGNYDSEYIYSPDNKQPSFLLSKTSSSDSYYWSTQYIVFGQPGHFGNDGAPLLLGNENYLLTYVGMKINDRALIKDFRIQLESGWGGCILGDSGNKIPLLAKWFSGIIPTANACGNRGNQLLGESKLIYVKEQAGISWFKLESPLLTRGVNSLQLAYQPNKKTGFLSMELSDMILQDKNKNFIRPRIIEEQYYSDRRCRTSKIPPIAYLAYLAPEEHGKITLRQDDQSKKIIFDFNNIGPDTITIDDDSIKAIRSSFTHNAGVQKFNIRDAAGSVVYTIPMDVIREDILGKTIEPNKSLSSRQFNIDSLQNGATYFITLESESAEDIPNQNKRKIIFWVLGSSAYFYPLEKWNDKILYKLFIESNGIMKFSEINSYDKLPL